jgi:hypothetical protein
MKQPSSESFSKEMTEAAERAYFLQTYSQLMAFDDITEIHKENYDTRNNPSVEFSLMEPDLVL